MRIAVLAVVVAMAATAQATSVGMALAGGSNTVVIDTVILYPPGTPVATPGFSARPGYYDTFDFHRADMPTRVVGKWLMNGSRMVVFELNPAVPDTWYTLPTSTDSRVKLLTLDAVEETEVARPMQAVSVAPRLARTSVTVRAEVAAAGARGLVRVYDAAGVPVREFALSTSKGILSARWDLTDAAGNRVSPGIYYCQVSAGSARGVAKVIVTQ
jgi:hypothetical protein